MLKRPKQTPCGHTGEPTSSTVNGRRRNPRALVACLAYNLFNSALFSLFIREALMIRGDGPGGFGELILKLLMSHMALALLALGLIASFKVFCTEKRGWGSITACVVATLILIGFSAIAVAAACMDDRGHCRNWHRYT